MAGGQIGSHEGTKARRGFVLWVDAPLVAVDDATRIDEALREFELKLARLYAIPRSMLVDGGGCTNLRGFVRSPAAACGSCETKGSAE